MSETVALIERPKRPTNLDQIIGVCSQATRNAFGEDVFTLERTNVHWVTREEFEFRLKNIKPKNQFILNSLKAVGVNVLDGPLDENATYLRDESTFPPNIYVRDDRNPAMESDDLREKTLDELNVAYRIVFYNILSNKIPKVFSDELLYQEVERKLERDRKRMPGKYPEMDVEEFNKAVNNVKFLICEDPTRKMILEGAEIRVTSRIRQEDGEKEEDIAVTGSDFEEELVEYLTSKVMGGFSKLWSLTYPPELSEKILQRFKQLNSNLTIGQKIAQARVERFLRALGLNDYRQAFQAHLKSEIPCLFVAAKTKNKKNKKIVYPS